MVKIEIRGYLSSVIASELVGISGTDLEVLDAIYHFKKASNNQLQRKFPGTNLIQVTKYLYSKKYITHASPEWKLTDKGLKVVEFAHEKREHAEKLISSDSFLFSLAKASGTFKD